MIVDPSSCAPQIIGCHGTIGTEWLQQLPDLLATYAERWALTIMPPFKDLSYNYVAPALRENGMHVVLKAGVPHRELYQEIQALQHFDGHGMVQLLEADIDRGVFLLERLSPGLPLTSLEQDQRATHIATQVMRKLWKPAPSHHTFATVAGWAAGLDRLRASFAGGTGPFPGEIVDMAEGLFSELLNPTSEVTLIHGDMHHLNILSSEREPWLAIDPKGVVGNPLYDIATFASSLPQPESESHIKTTLARRVAQLADGLCVDPAQIIRWGLAQSVLSGWWNFEDLGRGWEEPLARAELYASLM
jgi:streptomycin 6-kinase